jgi:hypothetical protein
MKKDDPAFAAAAPCGIHCAGCEPFLAKDNPALLEALVARGIPRDRLPCPGCRPLEGFCPVIEGQCETYACLTGRGYEFCYECPDFPCGKLNPASHRADVLPHNLKVFNLCCIQRHGLEAWLKEAPEIKRKYYRGKMSVGRGPRVE